MVTYYNYIVIVHVEYVRLRVMKITDPYFGASYEHCLKPQYSTFIMRGVIN